MLRIGEMNDQSIGVLYGELGKVFCPIVNQLFIENIDRRSHNDGSGELIPVFHNCH